jgi:RNA polymerase sigma factor (sigma-70 family)
VTALRTEDVTAFAPTVLGALVRRYGHFDLAEDAVQEALVAAAAQWPDQGRPDDPTAWLIRVASRRLVDALRSAEARELREQRAAPDEAAGEQASGADDTLVLLTMCCHPSLTASSQLALSLRAVGGLSTAEIARAFFVPETTMAQRISRAKANVARAGARFVLPDEPELTARMATVRQVLYVMFTEGHFASAGRDLQRRSLADEAIRLARLLHHARPDDAEAAGLLALLVLTDARRAARTRDGELVPLDEQDRTRWDADLIAEGAALIEATLASTTRLGPHQLQAAIAAVHDEAPTPAETDWVEIVALYDLLEAVAPNPMTTLNKAVALAEVHGPSAGLAVLDTLADDPRLADHHRLFAARAFLLERAGELIDAHVAYREAARRATSIVEQRHLERRARRLRPDEPATW